MTLTAMISFLFVASQKKNSLTHLSLLTPFSDLNMKPSSLQDYLRSDILRRSKELIALGWLGRAYTTVPIVFNSFLPSLFRLQSYNDESLCTSIPIPRGGMIVDCTLKESSIISRGIPIRLRLFMDNDRIESVKLLGIGCDVKVDSKGNDEKVVSTPMNATHFCDSINMNAVNKKLVVKAITSSIFRNIPDIMKMVKGNVDLEAIGPIQNFHPRNDLFALEGTSKKWLQQVTVMVAI